MLRCTSAEKRKKKRKKKTAKHPEGKAVFETNGPPRLQQPLLSFFSLFQPPRPPLPTPQICDLKGETVSIAHHSSLAVSQNRFIFPFRSQPHAPTHPPTDKMYSSPRGGAVRPGPAMVMPCQIVARPASHNIGEDVARPAPSRLQLLQERQTPSRSPSA